MCCRLSAKMRKLSQIASHRETTRFEFNYLPFWCRCFVLITLCFVVDRILLQFHRFVGLRAFLLQTFVSNLGIVRLLFSHNDGSDVLLWLELPCKSIPSGVNGIISFCNARRDNRKGKNFLQPHSSFVVAS